MDTWNFPKFKKDMFHICGSVFKMKCLERCVEILQNCNFVEKFT